MRSFVVAPAEMQAHAVGRDVAQRVVERLHVGRRDLHELGVAQSREGQVSPHGQVRAIDLEHEAGPVDRVVLLLHHVDEPRQVGLPTRVILVSQEVSDDAGRGGRHEGLGRLDLFQGCSQILDVLLHGRPVLPIDGPVAGGTGDRRETLGASGSLGKVRPIGAGRHRALAAEPGEAMADVGGVADLALLAVVDDVNAGLGLHPDDVGDGLAHAGFEGPGIGDRAGIQRFQQGRQVGRPGQTSRVRGEDPIRASLHGRVASIMWREYKPSDRPKGELMTWPRRLPLVLLGVLLASLVTQPASSQGPASGHGAQAHDMELVGHDDLQGRSAYQALPHLQGGRWSAYVGHHGSKAHNPLTGAEEDNGTSIVDVTDAAKPRYLAHIAGIPGSAEGGGAQMVRVCEGSQLPKGTAGKTYMLRTVGNAVFNSGHEVWDVTDPANPQKVVTVVTGLTSTHKSFWECDTGIAYLVSGDLVKREPLELEIGRAHV